MTRRRTGSSVASSSGPRREGRAASGVVRPAGFEPATPSLGILIGVFVAVRGVARRTGMARFESVRVVVARDRPWRWLSISATVLGVEGEIASREANDGQNTHDPE